VLSRGLCGSEGTSSGAYRHCACAGRCSPYRPVALGSGRLLLLVFVSFSILIAGCSFSSPTMSGKKDPTRKENDLVHMRKEMASFLRKPLLQRTPPKARRSSCPDISLNDEEVLNPRKKFRGVEAEPSEPTPSARGKDVDNILWQLNVLKEQIMTENVSKNSLVVKIEEVAGSVRALAISELETKKETENERKALVIRAQIRRDMTPAQMKTLFDEDWPKEAFKCTKPSRRNILSSDKTRIVIADQQDEFWKALFPMLRGQFPSLKGLAELQLEPGKIIHVENSDKLQIDDEHDNEVNKCRKIFFSFLDEASELLPTILEKVRMKILETQEKDICISVLSSKVDEKLCRKLLECIFVSDDISCEVVMPKIRRQHNSRRRKQTQGTIIVESESGKSFAEVVSKMKETLDPDSIGVTVKKVMKTATGKIKMIIDEKKQGGKEAMLAEMRKDNEIKVTVSRPERAIIINGLDECVTEKELRSALVKELDPEGIDAISHLQIRKGYRSTFNATAVLPKEQAEKAISLGSIRVGWIIARIKVKHVPVCCRKCQRYGHSEAECTFAETAPLCRRCGDEQHKAANCKNEIFCYVCKVKDHRADSMACPQYRLAVKSCKELEAGKSGRNKSQKND